MSRRSPRNQGLRALTGSYCAAGLQLFLRWRHCEGRTYGMSHRVSSVARQTAGDRSRQLQRESKLQKAVFSDSWPPDEPMTAQRVSWAGANGSDCGTFLKCLSEQREIPKANRGHPLPVCHPLSPRAERPQAGVRTRHGFKYVFVCSLFGGFTSHEKTICPKLMSARKNC